jgi:hypothetical protein
VQGQQRAVWVELQSVQIYQEEKHFHKTGHDKQDKYVWTINQDIDNLNERYYILEKHKGMNENLTYEHCMGEEKENRDTRKYEETHNQESILEDIQKVSYD